MLNIKPVSELRNYNKILIEVTPNNPVFLTKNGHGKYAVVDIEAYDRFTAALQLLEDVKEAKKGPFEDFDKAMDEIMKETYK